MKDKMIGRLLSERYEIMERIGSGGMANVYRARCNYLNRFVAIKILKEEYKGQEDFIKRFKTESRAVALLSHPNIVAVYDVGQEDDLPYIVMELIEGITLKQYIEQRAPLSYKEVLLFTYQILKALEHAHGRKIIHRDIKPQNIMLLRDGTIKVADFGIARFTLSNTQTMTETAIGSVHYISPEQAKGSVSDEKSDIYSVGVVMYEMLTGRVPFDADNPVMVAIMHLQSDPELPSAINADVLPGLESITMRAMSRETSLRYQSAASMLSDLETFKNNPNVLFNYAYRHDDSQSTQYFEAVRPEQLAPRPSARPAPSPQRRPPKKRPSAYSDYEASDREKLLEKVWLGVKIIGIIVALAVIYNIYSKGMEIFNTLMETGDIPIEMAPPPEEVEVPDLKGKMLSEVLEDEKYSRFKIVQSDAKNSETEPAGAIISQDREAGSTARPDSTINVVVSLGKKEIKIPDVSKVEYRTAMLSLRDLGLIPERVDENHDEIAVGYCIKTDPAPGLSVGEGAIVKVYVSMGKAVKMVETPSVLGKKSDEARKELVGRGFIIESINSIEDPAPKGTIIAQSVAPGAMVEEQTPIVLTMSLGTAKTMNFYVNLPLNPPRFTITIYVNGTQAYKGEHRADEGSLYVPISGDGSSMVEVYIDDRLHASELVKFE